ncbi:hypothetical protein DEA8626_03438 [Defluviimonas aquaemixtae]|uniref:Uncharacterized protein n=1 Tax=Albidovulum aquaemixtae TaxID=1542388 RepID=A0A2R8BLX7_9RHOB|nr:hypothetical protein [Defluviimonas aquaemixtae]SPH24386.1 hypothetical protein DEA8626_03438 [Defluviimonas aquaemixtae]
MGHIRLGTLPRSKKWRDVIDILESGADVLAVAEAAARASELDLDRASDDPRFQFIARLMVQLPLLARAPGFPSALEDLGAGPNALQSIPDLLVGLNRIIEQNTFEAGRSSDPGELARLALVETLSAHLTDRLPSLFAPEPTEIRRALAAFAGGQAFASLARDFFARLTYRSLDYYLSRELANHTGPGRRFSTDADRTAFQRALATHVFEASRIVEAFAAGWYGKTVWRDQKLNQEEINRFTRYAFSKMRSELGRRRAAA